MAINNTIAALLGVSAFRLPALERVPSVNEDTVAAMREAHGGQLAPLPQSQTRWYMRDIEDAERLADVGNLAQSARLMRSARKDGVYSGVLSTRTGGLVRLPKRFRGNPEIVALLSQDSDETRGLFDEMFPATELALLAADGVELGVGVAELVDVVGRDHPVMVRLDPEFLWYIWNDNQWYYRSIAGMIPITPGDGRWILHMPGGRVAPWQHGLWRAIGRAYIRKEHASLNKDNWESKLANAARVAVSPQGASDEQKQSWFRSVMAWGKNTVFGLTPGYDVKIIEGNGQGHESFKDTISEQNAEFQIAVAGQTVTTDGGAGFQNSDIHKSIRADLIKETADGLAHTVNTQGLPMFILSVWGEEALSPGATVEWDVTPPKDRNQEASAMATIAQATKQLTEAFGAHRIAIDANALAVRFGVPVMTAGEFTVVPDVPFSTLTDAAQARGLQLDSDSLEAIAKRVGVSFEAIPAGESTPKRIELAPTDIAKVVLSVEARASQGLPAFGDERDQMTVTELGDRGEADAEATGDVAVVEAEDKADDDEGGKQ